MHASYALCVCMQATSMAMVMAKAMAYSCAYGNIYDLWLMAYGYGL